MCLCVCLRLYQVRGLHVACHGGVQNRAVICAALTLPVPSSPSEASVYDQARFLYADNLDLVSYFNIKEDSLLVFTDRSYDGIDPLIPSMVSPLRNDMEEADIMMAVAAHSLPLLVPYSVQSQPFIASIPIKKHVLVFHDTSDRSTTLLQALEEIATEERGRLVFVTIPAVEHQLLQFFGLSTTDLPEAVLADMTDESNLQRYVRATPFKQT